MSFLAMLACAQSPEADRDTGDAMTHHADGAEIIDDGALLPDTRRDDPEEDASGDQDGETSPELDARDTATGGGDTISELADSSDDTSDVVVPDPDGDATSADIDDDTDDVTLPPDLDERELRAVVIAGDSWSTGFVHPLRAELDARGFAATELRYETTARAGSQARTWVRNEHPPAFGGGVDTTAPRMLDALRESITREPMAELLVLVISGNDFNRECADGWGRRARARRGQILDAIIDDVRTLIREARSVNPDLRVLLVGYDYFHFEFLVAFGLRLPGLDTMSYNEGLVELGRRQRALADRDPLTIYGHNYGLLQHVCGDTIHPPFSIPNPFTGYPEYDAGVAPRPGSAPGYDPFPGGFITYPAPLDCMPDGLHPSESSSRALVANALDQMPEIWWISPSPDAE